MQPADDTVEKSLVEVERARKRVGRGKSKQVTNSDEIDYLKSVAYAWFRSHRPLLDGAVAISALEGVDAEFQKVMDATGRYAARSTYLDSLKAAKVALVGLRSSSLVTPPVKGDAAELPPDFSALASDVEMRAILARRWEECQRCARANAHLAATVMMGGLLEALFVARANRMPDKRPLFQAKATPIDSKTKKPLALPEWTLRPYIDVGAELGWISRPGKDVASVLRDYRNYIHPEKERTHGVVLNQHDIGMFWEVTKSVAKQLLASVETK